MSYIPKNRHCRYSSGIHFDTECNLNWELQENPDGEFYVPTKALLLLKTKINNCKDLVSMQNK